MEGDTINYQTYLNKFNFILDNMTYEMSSGIITGNITKDFIVAMIPHHEAAILMSKNLLNYKVNSKLVLIAKDIIKVQENGIKEMKNILKTTTIPNNNYLEIIKYIENYQAIFKVMIHSMKNSLRSNNINLDFISEMIPHHEGAIEMCRNLLNYRIDERLRNLAKSIIKFQKQGIQNLKQIKFEILNKCN